MVLERFLRLSHSGKEGFIAISSVLFQFRPVERYL